MSSTMPRISAVMKIMAHTPNDNRGQHDQRTAVVAPQIAPGETEDNSKAAHHAALIAATGSNQRSLIAG